MEIKSTSNSRVKEWKKLSTVKGRKQQHRYLLDGLHLIKEALKANKKIDELLVVDDFKHLNELKIPHDIEVITISREIANSIASTKTPQGIFGILPLEDNKPNYPSKKSGAWLFLDNVQDPGNIGTMVRTADAAGFQGVVLGEGSADLYNPKVVRAMQGSQFHIELLIGNLLDWVEHFKTINVPVFGSELNKDAVEYTTIGKYEDFALIMGNEGRGMSEELIKATTSNLYIPIVNAESLNVAVAAGILMFSLKDKK